jgi:hypothetical protein
MVYLYSRNIKTFVAFLSSFKDPSFELKGIGRVSAPFLFFGYLKPYLILIETIRFLFGLFSITEIN